MFMDTVRKLSAATYAWCQQHPNAAAMVACFVVGFLVGKLT